jgi:hypothetical protein
VPNSYSAAVLRNRGVPIRLQRLDSEGAPMWSTDDPNDETAEPVTETAWVRITLAEMAVLEERFAGTMAPAGILDDPPTLTGERVPFYGMDAVGIALQQNPSASMMTVLSVALDMDQADLRPRMMSSETRPYAKAVMAAIALANGMDPQAVAADLSDDPGAASQGAPANRSRLTAGRLRGSGGLAAVRQAAL